MKRLLASIYIYISISIDIYVSIFFSLTLSLFLFHTHTLSRSLPPRPHLSCPSLFLDDDVCVCVKQKV